MAKNKAYTRNITEDGTTVPENHNDPVQVAVSGTWDGATVEVQVSFDNGVTWFTATALDGTSASFTDNGVLILDLVKFRLRGKTSNSGASTALEMNVVERDIYIDED